MTITNGAGQQKGQTLAVIGCGNMGSSILSAILSSSSSSSSLPPSTSSTSSSTPFSSTSSTPGTATPQIPQFTKFIATVNSASSASTLKTRFSTHLDRLTIVQGENVRAMAQADVIIWAFKPYFAAEILSAPGVFQAIEGKTIISVLAGSPIATLTNTIFSTINNLDPEADKIDHFYIKRVMPNVGAEYNQSMTVIEASPPSFPSFVDEITETIFSLVGKTQLVAPAQYDVAGVLAGASPAWLSVAFDGILDGAVSQGLKRADAAKILTQSLVSLATLLENGEHPAVLREKISSPKGTTIAGLLSLEEDRVRYAFGKATIASSERSQAIGKQK